MSLNDRLSEIFACAGLEHNVLADHNAAIFLDPGQNSIFSYRMRVFPPTKAALLESFIVGDNYKGNGQQIGGKAIRQLAAHLESKGVDTLGLDRVQDDGITFWPKFGALPNNCKRLGSIMAHMHSCLPEEHSDRVKVGEALGRIAQAPEATWFAMTDPKSDIGLSRETMRRVSQMILAQQTYVLEFNRPEVRARLALG